MTVGTEKPRQARAAAAREEARAAACSACSAQHFVTAQSAFRPFSRYILRCIRRWIEERGEGPSVRQLADDIGLSSTASVAYHLGNLEERGALVRDGRGWRTCRLVR
ncbi:LexA family protein [Streptomyces mirabilis]|uniref:LexA family protein n=1 Tax=Streptomyces mirabilis TaxID=68239 RepID=UPI0036750273